uniref:Bifunctional inhibitor/plant lipid transfer protein/seed storage helical domain-containing protein n=1 Tax=Setaria italica TaxID=4555 RepID=K3Y2A2_SETIT
AFSECVPYVVGDEPAVTPNCCTGLGNIWDMRGTAAQRDTLCACLLLELKAAGGGRMDPATPPGSPPRVTS